MSELRESEQPRSKLRGIGLLLRCKPRGIKPVHLRAVAEYKSKLLPPLVAYTRIKKAATDNMHRISYIRAAFFDYYTGGKENLTLFCRRFPLTVCVE